MSLWWCAVPRQPNFSQSEIRNSLHPWSGDFAFLLQVQVLKHLRVSTCRLQHSQYKFDGSQLRLRVTLGQIPQLSTRLICQLRPIYPYIQLPLELPSTPATLSLLGGLPVKVDSQSCVSQCSLAPSLRHRFKLLRTLKCCFQG